MSSLEDIKPSDTPEEPIKKIKFRRQGTVIAPALGRFGLPDKFPPFLEFHHEETDEGLLSWVKSVIMGYKEEIGGDLSVAALVNLMIHKKSHPFLRKNASRLASLVRVK